MSPQALIAWGARIFQANWTIQDGAGRPRTNGNGQPLSDPTSSFTGQRGLNRVSGPEANSYVWAVTMHPAAYPVCSGIGLPGSEFPLNDSRINST
jgi:hypothetical protein